ncbi:GAD-like domain-containing protein [Bacillus pseudomycoides]
MEQYLKDFKLHSKAPSEIIEKYKYVVPNEIINLWSNYGFDTFMQGYLR